MRSGKADKLHRVDPLPNQMAGVEVESELVAVLQHVQCALGRVQVEGNLGGMHFQGELHAALAKHVEDWVEPLGQKIEAVVDHFRRNWREGIEQRPNARAREAVDHAHAQLLGGPGGVLQLLGGSGIDFLRIAVAPDVWWQDGLVTGVNVVQHRLADQMPTDGEHLQIVLFQQFTLLRTVVVLVERLVDLEVIAPAGQLESIVAEAANLPGQLGHGQVGPLAGKQCYGSRHVNLLLKQLPLARWRERGQGVRVVSALSTVCGLIVGWHALNGRGWAAHHALLGRATHQSMTDRALGPVK